MKTSCLVLKIKRFDSESSLLRSHDNSSIMFEEDGVSFKMTLVVCWSKTADRRHMSQFPMLGKSKSFTLCSESMRALVDGAGLKSRFCRIQSSNQNFVFRTLPINLWVVLNFGRHLIFTWTSSGLQFQPNGTWVNPRNPKIKGEINQGNSIRTKQIQIHWVSFDSISSMPRDSTGD